MWCDVMSDIALRVENLSKRYKIGVAQHRHDTLRDILTETLAKPFSKFTSLFSRNGFHRSILDRRPAPYDASNIWALKDVSFEVRCGEVVGIIGHNGAGKSTLLKILSRITKPTTGFGEIHGRVGSLLEVGTGFHAELSGRENIYLNGAILGMRRSEIARKFDEIVAFAEVERFIDTPVKRYSSGMYMRLAFAVAAHLEPEILMIDEVLAVGDTRFQKKCLDKMQNVGQQGRTVLFVSHNMPAVTRLCERTILLDEGRVLRDGPSPQVVGAYLNSGLGTTAVREWPNPAKAPGSEVVRLRAVRVRTEDGRITDAVDIRQPVGIDMEYEVLQPDHTLMPNFNIFNEQGACAFTTLDVSPAWRRCPRPVGRYVSTAWIPGNLLAEGTLFIEPAMMTVEPFIGHFQVPGAVAFQVIDSTDGDSARGDLAGQISGVVRPLLKWSTQFSPNGREVHDGSAEEAKPK
jgi:lipopolysaccharide transport system ATP-binding protein